MALYRNGNHLENEEALGPFDIINTTIKKIIFAMLFLLVISAGLYYAYSRSSSGQPESPKGPDVSDSMGKEVTIEGVLTCIPSNTNPTTLPCLVGLQDTNKDYYRLLGVTAEELEKYPMGEKLKIKGVLSTSVNFGASIDVKEIYTK